MKARLFFTSPENAIKTFESFLNQVDSDCNEMDALQIQGLLAKGKTLLPLHLRTTDAILAPAVPSSVACDKALAQADVSKVKAPAHNKFK